MDLFALQTIGLSIFAGVIAQVIADSTRLPSILILLVMGVLLGPDIANLIQPSTLGPGLILFVKLAVAVILFEGAMNLRLEELKRVQKTVRRLVTRGVLITFLGGALTSHWISGLSWSEAFLFGALVTVTGPTVIRPLLRRIKVNRSVATVLEGEGILIDPIGAILAVVTLEVLLAEGWARIAGLLYLIPRLGLGIFLGSAGGWLLSSIFRKSNWIPQDYSNIVVLGYIFGLFGLSERLLQESGIMTVVSAGFVFGQFEIPHGRLLRSFKEQLSILFIGTLFILLSANLRLSNLVAEGWDGILTVTILMLFVRPINVFLCAKGGWLSLKERIFIAWTGPRGIVSAAVAGLFAIIISETEAPLNGERIEGLVFLTIFMTVVIQGTLAPLTARFLGVLQSQSTSLLIIGANRIGQRLAQVLQRGGLEVVLTDSNPFNIHMAQKAGLNATGGNALDERVLEETGITQKQAILAVTSNSEVNFLVCQLAKEEFRVAEALPSLDQPGKGIQEEKLKLIGSSILFGRPIYIEEWNEMLRKEEVVTVEVDLSRELCPMLPLKDLNFLNEVLPIAYYRQGMAYVCHSNTKWQPEDRVVFLAPKGQEEVVQKTLGLTPGNYH